MCLKIQKCLGIILLFLSSQLKGQNHLVEISNFGNNRGNLKMLTHTPKNIKPKVPLVIALHGCGQTAEEFAIQSGWNTLSSSKGFMVIYPEQKVENNINSCFNWFSQADFSKNDGESHSIKEMIQYAVNNYNVDTTKIYVVGLSAGGAMANIVMANYPSLINSGAVLSGIPFKAANNLQSGFAAMQGNIEKTSETWVSIIKENNPKYKGEYPKVIIFQGIDDPFVHSKNADIIELQWKGVHKLKNDSRVVRKFNENNDVTEIIYNQNNNPIVVKYEINNLGHAMAIDPGVEKYQGGIIGKFAVDKDFHSTYWTAKFFKLIE